MTDLHETSDPKSKEQIDAEVDELLTKVDGIADKSLQEEVRAALEDFKRTSDQWKPFEDLHILLRRVSHHLDYETSERKAFYSRLLAIKEDTKAIINTARAVALFIAIVGGFWSVIGCWALYDEIRGFFHAVANLISQLLK
jgi:hypothetical protein